MKKWYVMLIAMALSGVWADEASAPAAPVAVPTAAVLSFDTRDRAAAGTELGKSVSELLVVNLQETNSVDMVERAELDKALDELQLSASGLVDKESQNKLGKLVGAKILITGSIFKSGDKNYVVAKIIGTETSRVMGASVSGVNEPLEMLPELSQKISAIIDKNKENLLPKAPTQASTLTVLSAKIKGNNRKVFVNVKEDINVSIPDPAVETELKKLLLALGFEIVSDRAAADFAVTGEALAAHAGNYQKFTSASARVELSVFDKNKKLLSTGSARETLAGSTYVIAAKEALAQAALRLAGDVLPVMK